MNLSIFVIVPLLMLLGLWLARNDKQVRGVNASRPSSDALHLLCALV